MKSYIRSLMILGLGVLALASCQDSLSEIGESIQTGKDKVQSQKHFLQFEATTVPSGSVHTSYTTASLLGSISDPVYGDFRADFIAQPRHASGFAFAQEPKGKAIDSVELRVYYTRSLGLRTAPMLLSVYEVPRGYQGQDKSVLSLDEYAVTDRLLGSSVVTLGASTKTDTLSSSQAITYLPIKLNKELGERIYNATIQHPEFFSTAEAFSANLLGGLYVTMRTGSGVVVRVGSISLVIHYTYKAKDGKDAKAQETFVNTKLTAHASAISNTDLTALLTPSDDYTFSKGPAGVQTEITLPKDQMLRLLEGKGDMKIGTDWSLADAQLKLKIDNPAKLLLNPPTYVMLIPADEVGQFFKLSMSERIQSATSFISTAYTVTTPHYDFYNVSRVITAHLQKHAKYQSGRWKIDEDLKLRIVPVAVSLSTNNSGSRVITDVEEYLYPSFVRLKKKAEDLKIGVVSTQLK